MNIWPSKRFAPVGSDNFQKKAHVDWCKEMLKKYVQGEAKAVITSTQVTNYESMHMSSK